MARDTREYDKRRRENFKSQGICLDCGIEKAAPNRVRCEKCLIRHRKISSDERAFRRGLNLCVRCGRIEVYGYKTCEACREKHRKIISDYKAEHLEEINEKQRLARKGLEEKGLCTRCGKRKHAQGKKCCSFCLSKARAKDRERRGGLSRNEYPNYGMCYICGNPVVEGRRLCQTHLDNSIKQITLGRELSHNNWSNDNKLIFKSKTRA